MRKVVALLLGILLTPTLAWMVVEGPLRDPEDAFRDFLDHGERAEDQLQDPLILNGRRVVPLVIAAIGNRDMELRRYAIAFLGNGQYPEALPTLERILQNGSELDYVRADAFQSVFQIAPQRALELAPQHAKRMGSLGSVARRTLAGGSPVDATRSWWQAFRRAHDD